MTILERFSLSGRTALVTGGGTGIGRALAVALAEAGAAVAVAGRTRTTLDAALNDIRAAGQEGLAVVADVTQADQVERMIGAVVDRWGRLDIAINNAGVNNWVEAVDMSETDWDWAFDTNVKGVFLCAQAEARAMIPTGYGKIINIASGTVFKGTPMMLHYVSSKGAMVAFTRALAREVGDDGINVNAIAPGLTMSEKVAADDQWRTIQAGNTASRAIKREEVPEDLLGALIYFSSSDSDFVTGQTLVVDGGSAMH